MAKQTTNEDVLNFEVGQSGVNLTGMPLNMQPGDLLAGQNVEYVREAGLGGLGSRGALTPLNTENLGGAIMAFAAIPLASAIDNLTVDALFLMSPTGLLRSINGGTSWSPFDFSDVPDLVLLPWNPSLMALIEVDDVPTLYYPHDNGDGTTTIVGINLTDMSDAPAVDVSGHVAALLAFDGDLYIGINTDTQFEVDGSVTQISPVLESRVEVWTVGSPSTAQIGDAFGGYATEDDGTPRATQFPTQVNPNILTYTDGGITRNGSSIASMRIANNRVYIQVGALVTNNPTYTDNYACPIPGSIPAPPRPHISGFAAAQLYSIGVGETDWTLEQGGILPTVGIYQGAPAAVSTAFGTGIFAGAGGTDASGFFYDDPTGQNDCHAVPNTDGITLAPDPALLGAIPLTRYDNVPGGFAGAGQTLLVDDLNDGYGYFGPGIVFDSKLFVPYVSAPALGDGATAIRIYRLDADDDTNFPAPGWTIDLEVVGTFGGSVNPGDPYIVGTALYWPFASTAPTSGYILKRTVGAIWSKPTTGLDIAGPALSATVPL